MSRPAPIRVGVENDFARDTFHIRKPALVQDLIDHNPDYPAEILGDLAALHAALVAGGAVPMLAFHPAPMVDYDDWLAAHTEQVTAAKGALTWHHVEWFFAETYLYRYLMQIVRYFETLRDPFAPHKRAELATPALWRALDFALQGRESLPHLLACALWGNRVDLSYTVAAGQGVENVGGDDLLVDDRAAVAAHLQNVVGKTVHIIADNTGTELMMDLVLIDALLERGAAVVLHLKMHPTYVSDALPVDVWITLDALAAHGGAAGALGERLRAAWRGKRLVLAPHFYWNSSRFLWQMPPHLYRLFDGAFLVILKGDANYRRSVGDALWEASTPYAEVLGYFPAPLLALRTLKSDPIVGLPPGKAAALDATGVKWRVIGRHGVVQFKR